MKVKNSFYKKYSNTHGQFAVIDIFIANRKLSELFLDVRVYRGSDIGSDHFLTLAELRFPQKWLGLPKNSTCKGNVLRYKIILLNDESTRWLYK